MVGRVLYLDCRGTYRNVDVGLNDMEQYPHTKVNFLVLIWCYSYIRCTHTIGGNWIKDTWDLWSIFATSCEYAIISKQKVK